MPATRRSRREMYQGARFRQWAHSMVRRGRARNALARSAIAARVHTFTRLTESFGFISGVSGTSTLELVNDGTAPNNLITVTSRSASQFQAGAYAFGGALQFMLAHVANVSEITNLFDNYRIAKVVVNVIPQFNSADVLTGTTNMGIPVMHYAVDTDDAVAPGNRISLMENSRAQTVRLDRPFSISLKPRAQNVIAVTGGTGMAAGGMLPPGQWLDTASTNVAHNGLKFWIDEFPTAQTVNSGRAIVKFSVTYVLECKNVI